MKIVLVTPLYPPEVAAAAPYTKELAKRMSPTHTVSVVTYSHLPEQLPDVLVHTVKKNQPLPFRLISFFFALIPALRNADICYAQNGPSVEFPLFLASFVTRTPIFIHIGDPAAHVYAKNHFFRNIVERLLFSRAKKVLTDTPLPRPEILPLEEMPEQELVAYERSWTEHLTLLEETFSTYAT